MFQALSSWLYDDDEKEGDPLALLPFEQPLNNIKAWIENGDKIFEELLARLFLHNPHRTTVLLEPDHKMARRIAKEEADRLAEVKKGMTPERIEAVMAEAEELNRLQGEPDSPEALNSIPRLAVRDLPVENRIIPSELRSVGGCNLLYHDLPTNGIAYLDLGFDLSVVPDELLPYMGVFGRALVESGTSKRGLCGPVAAHRLHFRRHLGLAVRRAQARLRGGGLAPVRARQVHGRKGRRHPRHPGRDPDLGHARQQGKAFAHRVRGPRPRRTAAHPVRPHGRGHPVARPQPCGPRPWTRPCPA